MLDNDYVTKFRELIRERCLESYMKAYKLQKVNPNAIPISDLLDLEGGLIAILEKTKC